jgi:hypothetical protein
MAASQGPAGCSLCQAADASQKGSAYGVSKVLNPDQTMSPWEWSAGRSFAYYDNGSGRWTIQPGASDPAQVMSYSRCADTSEDDSGSARSFDEIVDAYGTTVAVAAGNSGPATQTVNDPALAYNVIAAGAYCCSSSVDRSTDTVWSWSSRGPTAGGRKKPDLVAPGDGDLADAIYNTTGSLWHYQTGTSFAAPQIAAGATLLAGAAIRDPKVVKALLINSARLGRSAPGEPWGSQVGWQPDFGWGELDLDAAYQQRLNFDAAEVPQNSARFYRATAQAAGERATLVWHRRVNPCSVLRTGCVHSDPSYHVYSLTNLDLAAYNAADATLEATSNSTIDNVEQVRTSGAGDVIYKVTAGYVDGHPAEPFALAAKQPLTRLVTPQPDVSVTTSATGPVGPKQTVTVTATISNPSPDLTAPNTSVTLTLPAGVEFVSGQPAQPLGTLAKQGSAGSTIAATWTVRGTADGVKNLKATATSTVYDTPLSSSATRALTVDAAGPQVAISSPAGVTPNPALSVAWGGSDAGSGVDTYDVDVSVNGGPFVPWLRATTQTAATYAGALGNRYRFRVRAVDALGNTSATIESDDISIVSVLTQDPTATNPGGSGKRAGAGLRIAWTDRRRTALVVGGTISSAASREVRATWTAKVRRKRVTVRGRGRIRSGRFTIKLGIPRRARSAKRATLTLTYRGDKRVRPATRRVSVRN